LHQEKIPYSFWVENVKLFELEKVLQQPDTIFVLILNRIRTNTPTTKYIAFLNQTFHRPTQQDPTFPYLFNTNKDVECHNKKMCVVQTIAYTLIDINKLVDTIEKTTFEQKNCFFPQKLN